METTLKRILVLLIIIVVFVLGVNCGQIYQLKTDNVIIDKQLSIIAKAETKIKSLENIIATVDNLGPAYRVIDVTMDYLDKIKAINKAHK
jgi:energy-converting hydrogenase Eha subunit H